MSKAWLLACIAVMAPLGCKGRDERKPAAAQGSAAAGSAQPAIADAAVAIDPAMRAFCVRSMNQLKKCFTDDGFWDAHATTFFAAQHQPIDPEAKKHWIGVYKDSFAALVRSNELEKNCDVMLAQNQLPTPSQMKMVDDASGQSCTAFGGALGYVIYMQGAFYKPRDGEMIPDTLAPPAAPH